MTQSLMGGEVELLNYFLSTNSISEATIPSMIVKGKGRIDMVLNRI